MIFSGVAHAALFVFAMVGFSQPRSFEDYQEAVPVEIINENELRQMMRGERNAPKPLPVPQQKADRVAELNERKADAPLQKQDVEVPPPPSRDAEAEAKAAQEKIEKEKAAARAQAQREKDEQERELREARALEAQRQREAAEKQRLASVAAAAAEKARAAAAEKARADAEAKKEEEAEERREAELERQRRQDEARKAAEAKRVADEKRAAEDKKRKEAEAKAKAAQEQALREKIEREEEAAEERKQAELEKQKQAKAAEARRAADAKKAADEKAKREAEARQATTRAQADGKPFNPADIEKLLQNKQRAASTGSTGPQEQRQASLGTQTGSAAKLNPSQREALIGLLREQMGKCMSVPPGSNPSARPTLRVGLNPDGSLAGSPSVASGDQAVGQAALRAIRGCAPYRIPARFAEYYGDWRSLLITIDASEL